MDSQAFDPPKRREPPRKRSCSPSIPSSDYHDQKRQKMLLDSEAAREARSGSAPVGHAHYKVVKPAKKNSQDEDQEMQDEPALKKENSKNDTVEKGIKTELVQAEEAKVNGEETSESIKEDAKEGIEEDGIGMTHFKDESSKDTAIEGRAPFDKAANDEKSDSIKTDNGSERQDQVAMVKPNDDTVEDAKMIPNEVKEEEQSEDLQLPTIETKSGNSDDDVRNHEVTGYVSDVVVYVSIDSKDMPDLTVNMEDVVARLGIKEERSQLQAGSDTFFKQENGTAPDVEPARILSCPELPGPSLPSQYSNATNEVDTEIAMEFMPGPICDKAQEVRANPTTEEYDQSGNVQPQLTSQDSPSFEETRGAHPFEHEGVFEKLPPSSEAQNSILGVQSNTQIKTTTQQFEPKGNHSAGYQITQDILNHVSNKPPGHITAAADQASVDTVMKDPNNETVSGSSTALPLNTLHQPDTHVEEAKQPEPVDNGMYDGRTLNSVVPTNVLRASVEDRNNTDEIGKPTKPRRSERLQKNQDAKSEKHEPVLTSENRALSPSKPAKPKAKPRAPGSRGAPKKDTSYDLPTKKKVEVNKSWTTASDRRANNSPEKIPTNNKNEDIRLYGKTSTMEKRQVITPRLSDVKGTSAISVGSDATSETNENIDDLLDLDKVANSLNSSVDHTATTLDKLHTISATNECQVTERNVYNQYPHQIDFQSTASQLPHRLEGEQTSNEAYGQTPRWGYGFPTDAPMHEDDIADLLGPDTIKDAKCALLIKFRTTLHELLNHDDDGTLIDEVIDEIRPFVSNEELIAIVHQRQPPDEDLERIGLMRIPKERTPLPDPPIHDFYVRDRELIRLDSPFVKCQKPHSVKVPLRISTTSHDNYAESFLSATHVGTPQNADRWRSHRNDDQAMFGYHSSQAFAPYTQQATHSTNNLADVINIDSSDDEAETLPDSRKLPSTRPRSLSGATGSSKSHHTGRGDFQKSSPTDGLKSIFSGQSTSAERLKNKQMRYQAPGITGSGRLATNHTTSSINADENRTNLVHGLKLDQYLNDVKAIHWSLASEEIPRLLDHKSWGCTKVLHEEESFRGFIQKNQRSQDEGYSVMDGFPLVEDVQFVVPLNTADPDGDCYWRALATCLHGTPGAWDVVKAEHLGYLHHVLKRPQHPRHELYRDSLNSKLYTVESPARGKFDANLWQLLHMPHAWVPAAMQQITADLYNVMLVTFSTDDNSNLYEVNTRGSYNSRHIFMLFTGGNHYCPMFPNEFMPWEFRYPRPTLESTFKYECGPDPARTMRRNACQHSWRSDITKSVMPPVPRLHGYPINKLRTLMSANRSGDW